MPEFTMIGYGITRRPATIKNMKPAEVEKYTEAADALLVKLEDGALEDVWAGSKAAMMELVLPLQQWRTSRNLSTATLIFKTEKHRHLLRVVDKSIELRLPRGMSEDAALIRCSSDGHVFMFVKDDVK